MMFKNTTLALALSAVISVRAADLTEDTNKKGTAEGGNDKTEDFDVTLSSQEGTKFEVKKSVIMQSDLVSNMIEDTTAEDAAEINDIPLPNVRNEVLQKVIDFVNHVDEEKQKNKKFPEISKPLTSTNMEEVVKTENKWYATFVDMPMELLFEVILAANYMDIPNLLDLTCAKVASMIKGKTPEEIQQTFGIVPPELEAGTGNHPHAVTGNQALESSSEPVAAQ